jgi:hypothetical protein
MHDSCPLFSAIFLTNNVRKQITSSKNVTYVTSHFVDIIVLGLQLLESLGVSYTMEDTSTHI